MKKWVYKVYLNGAMCSGDYETEEAAQEKLDFFRRISGMRGEVRKILVYYH